jgi:hypothetical protein
VTIFHVGNEDDAWRALEQLDNASALNLRFQGWPRLVLEASEAIDGVQSALAVTQLQALVERLYCSITYGRPDRRRLTNSEKSETRLDVRFSPDNKKLIIDFSRPMNAMVWAQRRQCEFEDNARIGSAWQSQPERQDDKYDPYPTTWPGAVRDICVEAISNITPRQTATVLTGMILATALTLGGVTMWQNWLEYKVSIQEEDNRHQLAMKALDEPIFETANGQHQTLNQEFLRIDQERIRLFAKFEKEGPLVSFVSKVRKDAYPVILGLAPRTGHYSVNDLKLPAEVARAALKTASCNSEEVSPLTPTDGWTAVVSRTS